MVRHRLRSAAHVRLSLGLPFTHSSRTTHSRPPGIAVVQNDRLRTFVSHSNCLLLARAERHAVALPASPLYKASGCAHSFVTRTAFYSLEPNDTQPPSGHRRCTKRAAAHNRRRITGIATRVHFPVYFSNANTWNIP